MKNVAVLLVMLGFVALFALAKDKDKDKKDADDQTLRFYADQIGFRIGSGIKPRSWDQDQEGQRILAREFNSTITMGMMNVTQPRGPRDFDFGQMDRTIAFARKANMKIWGSALIYRPDSLPEWMKDRMRGGPKHSFSDNELESIMKDHIQGVIRHGGDNFYAWGVVNEPLSHRNNPWEIILGKDDYIEKAYRYAREATDAPLVLNETFGQKGIDKERADEFFDIVKRMKAKNVPIDGVGTEMHLEAQQLDSDYLDQFKDFLRRARELRVTVYITEMDVYQGQPGSVKDPWETQRKIYHDVAAACLADTNCKGLTVWDLSDKDTWLVKKKQAYLQDAKPDLFNDDHNKKPAYYGVLEALREAAESRKAARN
jgi:GH35 family endo-1,4-beta-xylanase